MVRPLIFRLSAALISANQYFDGIERRTFIVWRWLGLMPRSRAKATSEGQRQTIESKVCITHDYDRWSRRSTTHCSHQSFNLRP